MPTTEKLDTQQVIEKVARNEMTNEEADRIIRQRLDETAKRDMLETLFLRLGQTVRRATR